MRGTQLILCRALRCSLFDDFADNIPFISNTSRDRNISIPITAIEDVISAIAENAIVTVKFDFNSNNTIPVINAEITDVITAFRAMNSDLCRAMEPD